MCRQIIILAQHKHSSNSIRNKVAVWLYLVADQHQQCLQFDGLMLKLQSALILGQTPQRIFSGPVSDPALWESISEAGSC